MAGLHSAFSRAGEVGAILIFAHFSLGSANCSRMAKETLGKSVLEIAYNLDKCVESDRKAGWGKKMPLFGMGNDSCSGVKSKHFDDGF